MIRRLRRLIFRLALLGLAAYVVAVYVVPPFCSLPENLVNPSPAATEFTDREGRPLRKLLNADDLRTGRPVTFNELPENLINATVAAEDWRYWSHNGLDLQAMARVFFEFAQHGHFMSGGSTISQQLIKISSPPRRRSIPTKVREIVLARKLEMTWEKEDILAAYLNRLPYGNLLTGCRAAARGYFNKPLSDLSVAESAFLAALPNAPTRLNPYRNFEGAKERQEKILGDMRHLGFITEDEYQRAFEESILLVDGGYREFRAPHFVDLVLSGKSAPADTPIVRTTIDLPLQTFVENTLALELGRLQEVTGKATHLQGAAVVMHNPSGEVLTLVGSRNFFDGLSGQVNGAWAARSAGSTLKPFTYLLAMQRGDYHASSLLADLPVEYGSSLDGVYRPENYDKRFRGPVRFREALASSLNVPAVRLLHDIGGHHLLYGKLQELGISTLAADPDRYGLGLTIGNAEVRLLELTNAYACLARLGEYQEFRLLRDQATGSNPVRRFSATDCYLIADILSDNNARSGTFGAYSPLRFPFRVACKTGTSTDYRDNWTVGFTPEFTVGVWVGSFENTPLRNVSGVSGAGPVFQNIFQHLYEAREPGWYERPATLVSHEIDALTGKTVSAGLPARHRLTEWYRPGREPKTATAEDYDESSRSLLPAEYATWLSSQGKFLANRVFAAKPSAEDSRMPSIEILSPPDGTVAYLDADLPRNGSLLPLKANASGPLEWTSPTLKIDASGSLPFVILQPGRHELRVRDTASGHQASVNIEVETL